MPRWAEEEAKPCMRERWEGKEGGKQVCGGASEMEEGSGADR